MNTLKRYSISFLLIVLVQMANAQSLREFLKIAAENNPGIKAQYADFEAALQGVAQVNSLPDPQLSFGYFINPIETRVGPQQARLGLTQMFPWFGVLSARGEAASLMAEARYQNFLNGRNELYYKVKSAWLDLYFLHRTLSLQKEYISILNTYKHLSLTHLKTGKGDMVDAIRVDLVLQYAKANIELTDQKIRPVLTLFNGLLNREDTVEVTMIDTVLLISDTAVVNRDSMFSGNPLLAALHYKMRSAEVQEIVARKSGMPSIGVGIDYFVVGKNPNLSSASNGQDALMPKLSISLPIYRGRYNAANREAQFRQEALRFSIDNYENELVTSYEMAQSTLDNARIMDKLYKDQLRSVGQAIDLLTFSYRHSGEEIEEVLGMQQKYLDYQIAAIEAAKMFHKAKANLDYLTAKEE